MKAPDSTLSSSPDSEYLLSPATIFPRSLPHQPSHASPLPQSPALQPPASRPGSAAAAIPVARDLGGPNKSQPVRRRNFGLTVHAPRAQRKRRRPRYVPSSTPLERGSARASSRREEAAGRERREDARSCAPAFCPSPRGGGDRGAG